LWRGAELFAPVSAHPEPERARLRIAAEAPPDFTDPVVQREMVERIRAGNVAAFEMVFRAYRPALTRVAARVLVSEEAARDVVQEVFLKIWRTRATWEAGGHLTAYLFAMTRNMALNEGRRGVREAKRQRPMFDDDGDVIEMPDRGPTLDVIVDARDRLAAVGVALAQLPARDRETFLLRWRDQLTYSEVAATLGLPVKTVEKRLGRVFAALRRALAPWTSGEP
jgi:RNA polymerase sigma-70 factor (ECF subfamily)